MKYVLILPDGAADEPVEELDGKTPLEYARTPSLDAIATEGRQGTVVTVPLGFDPHTDVATLSILGYDPKKYYTGRAPIEAAAHNIPLGPTDIVFRCNLVTIVDGEMVDYAAGHIGTVEARQLIADLNEQVATSGIEFHAGVSYRHLMVIKNGANIDVRCKPPHDIPGELVEPHLPMGKDAERIRWIMESAAALLESHDINAVRRDLGENPATDIWLWGQGRPPKMPTFQEKYGVKGACIAAVDVIRGMAAIMGFDQIPVAGATGYLDTNYRGKGDAAVAALDDYDLVVVHIEAPDEAGHNGDAAEKVRALEQIDEDIVAPVLARLRTFDGWKIMVAPDHPTPVGTRCHTATPPPFCIAGTGVHTVQGRPFSEANARLSDLHCDPGHELIEYLLKR